MLIHFKDPFQQETIVTVLPIEFNKTIQFAVNSKYKYVAVWDLGTAKCILKELQNSIQTLEETNAKEI